MSLIGHLIGLSVNSDQAAATISWTLVAGKYARAGGHLRRRFPQRPCRGRAQSAHLLGTRGRRCGSSDAYDDGDWVYLCDGAWEDALSPRFPRPNAARR